MSPGGLAKLEPGVELQEPGVEAQEPDATMDEPLSANAVEKVPPPAVRWRNLAMGMLVILSGGTVYSFGAYSSALKASLALSQEQLELAALCSNIGNYVGVAGFFYDRFGARTSVTFGACLIGAGYGAQWLLMSYGGGLGGRTSAPLLCACCFVWGHGSGYLDVAAIGTSVSAFPRHRGAVVGLLKSLYGLASSLIVLFAAYWTSGTTFVGVLALLAFCVPTLGALGFVEVDRSLSAAARRGAEPDAVVKGALNGAFCRICGLAGIALVLAVARIVAPKIWEPLWANVLASIVVVLGTGYQLRVASGPSSPDASTAHSPLFREDDGDDAEAAPPPPVAAATGKAGAVDSEPRSTLVAPELWLFLLSIVPGAGMGLMTINNLGQIVSARGGSIAMQRAGTTVVSIANCLGRLVCGRVADALVARGWPRPALMIAADAGGAAAMLLLWATGESVGAALLGTALAGWSYGMIWTLIPTLASDLFGNAHFGSNYMLCLPAVLSGSVLFSTVLAPKVYAAHLEDGSDTCSGAGCFGDTFLATALACLFGAGAALVLARRSRGLYRLA